MTVLNNFIKTIILITSPFFALRMFGEGEYFLSAFCILSFCLIFYVVKNSFNSWFNMEDDYAYTSRHLIDWWQRNEETNIKNVSNKCKISGNVINMQTIESGDTTIKLLPIKEIVAKELEKKEHIIDITNKKQPTFLMAEILEQESIPQKSHEETAILIKNKSSLTNEEKGTYKTIIDVLKKYDMMADKKYALFQSFIFIDVYKEGIIIYIDYDILKKAQLNETHLHKDEIISALRKAMHCDQLIVQFEEYKVKNLLNYFLEN